MYSMYTTMYSTMQETPFQSPKFFSGGIAPPPPTSTDCELFFISNIYSWSIDFWHGLLDYESKSIYQVKSELIPSPSQTSESRKKDEIEYNSQSNRVRVRVL